MELLSAAALWVEPKGTVRDCRDSKDNYYIELAPSASAAIIVSGDENLLTLDPWHGIQVLRPTQFFDYIEFGK